MKIVRVAIAGFGGVGRATATLLLARRERYRQVHDADIRLVAVCGSRAGLADAEGLEAGRLGALEPGLSGPAFIKASGAEFTMPPTDVTASRIAMLNDTCGNLIQVTQLMRW